MTPCNLVYDYQAVGEQKQLRTGLSINFTVPGEICQVLDMASFLIAILTGHAPVWKRLSVMGLYDGGSNLQILQDGG